MDISSITTLLGSVKTAAEIAKLIKDSGSTLEQAEVKLKLADLISTLADVKLEVAGVQQQLLEREARIRDLENELKTHISLTWEEPCYWQESADGQRIPYCQPCYDADRRLSRLHTDNKGFYQCRVCDKNFTSNARNDADNAGIQAAADAYRRARY
jgi:hypothetical protein